MKANNQRTFTIQEGTTRQNNVASSIACRYITINQGKHRRSLFHLFYYDMLHVRLHVSLLRGDFVLLGECLEDLGPLLCLAFFAALACLLDLLSTGLRLIAAEGNSHLVLLHRHIALLRLQKQCRNII